MSKSTADMWVTLKNEPTTISYKDNFEKGKLVYSALKFLPKLYLC